MEDINHFNTMNPEKVDLIDTIIKGLTRIAPPFIVGLMAKVANDITGGKRRSIISWAAIVVLCLAATFMSNWICEAYNISKNNTLIINAFSTLFAEQLFKILFANALNFIQEWVKDTLKFTLNSISNKGDGKQGSTKTPPTEDKPKD